MKRFLYLVAVCVLLLGTVQKASAQFYFYDKDHYDTPLMFEVGGSVGVMNCLTDLGGKKGFGKPFVKDLNVGNNQINSSIYINALYKYAIGLRLEGTFGTVNAHDSILESVRSTTAGRYERNLMFRSKINEVSLVAEFHILYIARSFLYEDDLNQDDNPPRLSPYFAAGIGYFSFNPQAYVRNSWIDLQPLSTEGQGFAEYADRKPYKLSQVNYQLGFGLKYELSSAVNLRLEFLHRVLSTDYLDDVSTRYIDNNLFQNYLTGVQLQHALELNRNNRKDPAKVFNHNEKGIRGDPTDNDAFFNLNFKIGLAFGRQRIH